MEKKKSKSNFAAIFSLCAVMYSAYVGPGFASGTQTVSYFSNKGWIGVIVGPVIAALLCFVFNLLLVEINRIYKPKTYREAYNTIYRPKALQLFFGTFKEVQVVVVILIALSAQISTTASLLNQIFGLPRIVGTVGFCLAVLLLALWGASLLRKVGTVLGVAILLICGYVAVVCFGNATPLAMSYLSEGVSYTEYGFSGPQAWFSMLMIVVFFMNGYEACVPASIGIIKTRKDVFVESLVTALLCGLSTMIFTFIFAAGMPDVLSEEIPTLWAINSLSNAGWISKILYAVFAVAAMLSGSVAFIFTVCNRFEPVIEKVWTKSNGLSRKFVIAMVFIVICTFGSSFGLLNIIKYGYGTFTTIVGPVMLIPLIVSVPYRLWKDRKDGILDEHYDLKEMSN
ncbi:MAG: hypothetical protein PHC41_08955 [Lachnospiraceae bacterium]|nr:hypothetical protein [Lachnospiraceae bacterium]MDD3616337.1 hypothetical protein [Lachnospiraceae bacterium]